MVVGIALPGFDDFGCSVTPILFSEKMKKIYQILFFLALCLSVQRFQMPLERLNLWKSWWHLELFAQQIHFYKIWLKIICLWFFFNTTINPCRQYYCWLINYVHQFFKMRVSFPHALSLKQSGWSPIFFAFLTQVTHYTVQLKNNLLTKKLSRERP